MNHARMDRAYPTRDARTVVGDTGRRVADFPEPNGAHPNGKATGRSSWFATPTARYGGMHVIAVRGGAKDGPIIVAKGYTTAAALGEASGHAVVCAFDAGNLKAVAETPRAKHPQRTIILAADDD